MEEGSLSGKEMEYTQYSICYILSALFGEIRLFKKPLGGVAF
jgi:hypothetical protein